MFVNQYANLYSCYYFEKVTSHSEDVIVEEEYTEEVYDDATNNLTSSDALDDSRKDNEDNELLLSSVVDGLQINDNTLSMSDDIDVVDPPILDETFSVQQEIIALSNFNHQVSEESNVINGESSEVQNTQYLNLGKWEKSIEISDSKGGFQFGTFGPDDSSHVVTAATSRTTSWTDSKPSDQNMTQSWQQSNVVQVNTNSVDLPSSTTSLPGSDINSLFPIQHQKQSIADSQLNASRFDQKHILPPGLDTPNQIKALQNKLQKNVPTPPQQSQPQSRKPDILQQNQYQNQPPIFPQQVGNNNPLTAGGRGNIMSTTPNLVAPFYSGFDIAPSAQYGQPYPTSNTNPASSTSVTPNVSTSNIISTSAAATNTATLPQPNQQQASFAPPPGMTSAYGYYPYGFPNQAYYYSQPNVPNYYGQNRGVYQNARSSFQNDPYSNNGNMYPPDIYAAGQFQDSSSTYGHPNSIPQPGGANINSVNNNLSNNVVNNKPKSGTAIVNQQPIAQSDINSYSYNPYAAARGTGDQSWQYQNSNQGWGGHMMPFPVGSQTGNGSAIQQQQQNNSFMPQTNQISQQQQQQQNSRGVGGSDPNQRPNSNSNLPSSNYNNNNSNVFNRGSGGGTVNSATGHQW